MKTQIAIDMAGLAGFALLVEGTRRVYPPAALILAGVILLGFAAFATRGNP